MKIYRSSNIPIQYGYTDIVYRERISIQCQSTWRGNPTTWQEHSQAMEDEVIRIVEGKQLNPSPGWHREIPIAIFDLDDKGFGYGKRVIDVQLMRLKDTTPI